jgi:hypothetical protein
MKHIATFISVLGLAGCLAAQTTITTAPSGFEATRGTSSVLYPFSGTQAPVGSFRYQEVHTTLRNTVLSNIVSVSFRRDESATASTTAVARTANIEFALGHGDVEQFTPDYAANFTGGRNVVFVRKPVNMADWTAPGDGATPMPWTNRLPFDVPFSYLGIQDLVWEVSYDSMTPTGTYNSDRATNTGSLWTSRSSPNIGTGCVATGRTAAFTLNTTLYHHIGSKLLRMQYWVTNGPSNQTAILHIDGAQSSLTAPFLCGTVIALPTIALPIGLTGATGSTPTLNHINIPFRAVFVSNSIYMQSVALDPGQTAPFVPLVLSQGEDVMWPALTVTTPASTAYIYNADLTAALGNGPFTAGSVITGFEH